MAHVQKHAEQVGGRINGQNWWKRPMEVIVQEAQPQRRYVTNTSVQVTVISCEMMTVISCDMIAGKIILDFYMRQIIFQHSCNGL